MRQTPGTSSSKYGEEEGGKDGFPRSRKLKSPQFQSSQGPGKVQETQKPSVPKARKAQERKGRDGGSRGLRELRELRELKKLRS